MQTPIIILVLLVLPLMLVGALRLVLSSRSSSRASGRAHSERLNVRKYAAWGLGLSFLFFAMGHVVKADLMVEMLPEFVPYRLAIIYLTGLLELLIGIACFVDRFYVRASQLAMIVFVVFFPANIYAAMNQIGLGGHQWGLVYLWIRVPLQIVLISWAYFVSGRGAHGSSIEKTEN